MGTRGREAEGYDIRRAVAGRVTAAPPLVIERSGVPTESSRLRFWTEAELAALPPPVWLLEQFIPENSLAVLYGPPAVGKSFLALEWAMRVATCEPWLGRATRSGPAVFTAAEGGSGLAQRLAAYRKARAVTRPSKALFVREAVNLLSPADV